MGCDIHIIAEVKVGGKWQPNQDKIFRNPYYSPEKAADCQEEEFQAYPPDNRRYDWFSVLADVRNGYGFAGIKTGAGFSVIAEPRGVPDDASEEWKVDVEIWNGNMHSRSWLGISDFDKFNWDQQSVKQGVIPLEDYKTLRGTNESPTGWCGGISGLGIRTITQSEADKLLDSGKEPKEEIYVTYQWSVTYRDWFKNEIETIVEPLRELAAKYGDARVCFGFDN